MEESVKEMKNIISLGIFLLLHNQLNQEGCNVDGLYVNVIPRHFLQYQLHKPEPEPLKEEEETLDEDSKDYQDNEATFPRGMNFWLPLHLTEPLKWRDKRTSLMRRSNRFLGGGSWGFV